MKYNGLTDKQVEESRSKFGSNEIPDSEPTTFWEEFKETFSDPMIKILLAIAALMIVMFFFGYAEIYEPLGTIVAVLIVATVSAKTGVASDTKYRELKDNTEKDKCKVHRNGVITVIDVDDVVVEAEGAVVHLNVDPRLVHPRELQGVFRQVIHIQLFRMQYGIHKLRIEHLHNYDFTLLTFTFFPRSRNAIV